MSTTQTAEKSRRTAGIHKKLLELQKAVRGLGRDASGNGYQNVSGSKLLYFVRPKMDELGLLLKQEVLGIEYHREDYATRNGQKAEMFTSVRMRFTWIDTEIGETDVNEFIANGMNAWDKGLGSALTYGERYFLLKYFHIPTDEDDVDAIVRDEAESVSPQQAAAPDVSVAIAEAEAAKDAGELNAVWAKWSGVFGNSESFRKAIAENPANPGRRDGHER